VIIEASDFAERVKPAAMRITAEVVQRLEFTEDGDVDGSAESVLEIIQSGDFVAQQKRAQSIGAEGSWPYNVIVPIEVDLLIDTVTNLAALGQDRQCVWRGLFLQGSRADLVYCGSPPVTPGYDR